MDSSPPAPPRYRGRFAPTPSGPLHFGSLVAAVASYAEAKNRRGAWMVRIDDLDPPRVAEKAADHILRTLEALRMEWDGPVVYQSNRHDAYHAALHRLRQLGNVYPCGCSRREIADAGMTGTEGPVYPGTCRGGLPARKCARALRLLTPDRTVAFDDGIQGAVSQDIARSVGDFVLYRANQVYAYHLAVVVDDAEQGVTHVVRGADLLDSTPRQIMLQGMLGIATPYYAHVPVAVNAAGEKLSKQTRATAIDLHAPAVAIAAALRFLGQALPPAECYGNLHEFWQWAMAHWQRERVPHVRTLPARSQQAPHRTDV
jgi:glutamyl-Q tRNA(Asp) synthetase